MARGAIRQRTNHGDTQITEAETEASARRPLACPMPINLDGHADDALADVLMPELQNLRVLSVSVVHHPGLIRGEGHLTQPRMLSAAAEESRRT